MSQVKPEKVWSNQRWELLYSQLDSEQSINPPPHEDHTFWDITSWTNHSSFSFKHVYVFAPYYILPSA